MGVGETPTRFGHFVGRERERGELCHALEEAREGRGRLFLVSGEPGIGKTRLAEEIAREASARGVHAVWGRCWEGDGAPAYWPWIQIVRGNLGACDSTARRAMLESEPASSTVETVAQIVPEMRAFSPQPLKPAAASQLGPEEARFQLFDAVATLLKSFARLKPCLIVLDDLHDADDASLAMLRFVANVLRDSCALIVGTYREHEVRLSAELTKHIGDLSRDARSIPLSGLSESEVAAFVETRSGGRADLELIANLHAATAGNPLYVDGIVRTMLNERESQKPGSYQFKIPHSVNEAIRRRLSVLSKEARAILGIATVIGNEFEADLCARVARVTGEELDRLLDEASTAGIITLLDHHRYRFGHALIRGFIESSLDKSIRVGFHRVIGEAIEEIHANDLEHHLTDLAHHFREAGVRPKAIDYSVRAGRSAIQLGADAEAVKHWEPALRLMEEEDASAERRAQLSDCLFGAILAIDQLKAVQYAESAIALYEGVGLSRKAAMMRVRVGRCHAIIGDPASNNALAIDHFRRAEPVLAQGPENSELAWLYEGIAASEQQGLNLPASSAAARRGMEIASRVGDQYAWSASAAFEGFVLAFGGRLKDAFAIYGQAFEAADQANRSGAGLCVTNLVWGTCSMLSDPREGRRWLERELNRPRNKKNLWARYDLSPSISASYFDEGQMRETVRQGGLKHPAISLWVRDEWEGAAGTAESLADASKAIFDRVAAIFWSLGAAFSFTYLGDYSRAEANLRYGLDNGDRGELVLYEMRARPLLASIYVELNRLDDADAELQRCRKIMEAGEDWRGCAGHVARATALVAAARGEFDSAFRQFESALAIYRKYHLAGEEAETLRNWARALAQAGDTASASEKYDQAIELNRARGCGPRFIEWVAAEKARSLRSARVDNSKARQSDPARLHGTFAKEGEFWTLAYQGATFRLKDIKGLAYLSHLLAHPGQQFHVRDLAAVIENAAGKADSIASLGSSDLTMTRDLDGAVPPPDAAARVDYRNRIEELRAELDEAERFNDTGRAELARRELDFLNSELTSRLGLGGRARQGGSHSERARLMVGKNIRTAIEKIRSESPALARHLTNSIRTGYFSSYEPDRDQAVSWQL